MRTLRPISILLLSVFLPSGLDARQDCAIIEASITESMPDSVFTADRIAAYTAFESGALDSLSVVGDILKIDVFSRPDPLNPVDTALEPSARWYSFMLSGVKGREVLLNFNGSEAVRPFYSYDGKAYRRFSACESIGCDRVLKRFSEDSVYIAYFIPYTYSYLLGRLEHWSESSRVSVSSAGKSTLGNDMPLLVITDAAVPDSLKKIVYMHGRTHTSEAPCSWHLDAVIERLAFGEDPLAAALRCSTVFYIVPFANPDGVIRGLSRSNVTGVNQEINWDRPDPLTSVEVSNLKSLLESIMERHGRIDMALNMHSQVEDYATYWVHTAESTSERFFSEQMRLARLTMYGNPYFKPDDLEFSDLAPRYVEGWLWKRCGEDCLAITFETPYTYYSENPDGEWVSLGNLSVFADHTVRAIGDFFHVSVSGRLLFPLENKRRSKILARNLPEGRYSVSLLERDGCGGWIDAGTVEAGKSGKVSMRLDGRKYVSVKLELTD